MRFYEILLKFESESVEFTLIWNMLRVKLHVNGLLWHNLAQFFEYLVEFEIQERKIECSSKITLIFEEILPNYSTSELN